MLGSGLGLLVGDEDLEAADDLSEGHALVLLPVLDSLLAVGEDHEVVLSALEVDLDLGSVSAHIGGCMGGGNGGCGEVVNLLVAEFWCEDVLMIVFGLEKRGKR